MRVAHIALTSLILTSSVTAAPIPLDDNIVSHHDALVKRMDELQTGFVGGFAGIGAAAAGITCFKFCKSGAGDLLASGLRLPSMALDYLSALRLRPERPAQPVGNLPMLYADPHAVPGARRNGRALPLVPGPTDEQRKAWTTKMLASLKAQPSSSALAFGDYPATTAPSLPHKKNLERLASTQEQSKLEEAVSKFPKSSSPSPRHEAGPSKPGHSRDGSEDSITMEINKDGKLERLPSLVFNVNKDRTLEKIAGKAPK